MKKNILLLLSLSAIVVFSVTSCEKTDKDILSASNNNDESFCEKLSPLLTDNVRRSIAKQFAATLSLNTAATAELHNAIDIAYQYGVDEFIYVYDSLVQQNSKFLGSNVSLTNIRNVVMSSNIINLCRVNNYPYVGNLQFYWPYHDDWDGVTPPYVIFEPLITNSNVVMGYRAINGVVDSLQFVVSDMDNSKASVIVIKEAEFPYTIYPSFKDGVFTQNGVTWIRRTVVTGINGVVCFDDQSAQDKDTLVEATTLFFKSSTHQYDSWFFGGGSEFMFSFAVAYIDSTSNVYQYKLEMTRKQIRNGAIVSMENLIHPNWNKQCPGVYYRLAEEDANGTSGSLSIKLAFKNDSISANISIKSTDDEIGKSYFERNDYIGKCLSGSNSYNLGNGELLYVKTRLYPPVEI